MGDKWTFDLNMFRDWPRQGYRQYVYWQLSNILGHSLFQKEQQDGFYAFLNAHNDNNVDKK